MDNIGQNKGKKTTNKQNLEKIIEQPAKE